jgi:hypothetical protein
VLYRPSTTLSRGFKAKAQYHRFLEHKVITLQVPFREDRHNLARAIVAVSSGERTWCGDIGAKTFFTH